ncbi:unknown [Parasutterella excrementihominis CAG:233]|nr:unknown [Parasutterella excrementihominis CAG:233]
MKNVPALVFTPPSSREKPPMEFLVSIPLTGSKAFSIASMASVERCKLAEEGSIMAART